VRYYNDKPMKCKNDDTLTCGLTRKINSDVYTDPNKLLLSRFSHMDSGAAAFSVATSLHLLAQWP